MQRQKTNVGITAEPCAQGRNIVLEAKVGVCGITGMLKECPTETNMPQYSLTIQTLRIRGYKQAQLMAHISVAGHAQSLDMESQVGKILVFRKV